MHYKGVDVISALAILKSKLIDRQKYPKKGLNLVLYRRRLIQHCSKCEITLRNKWSKSPKYLYFSNMELLT